MTSAILSNYHLDHLQEVLTAYRRSIIKLLNKGVQSDEQIEALRERITITDELADTFNMLEREE
jgi:hypothetical protein